MTEEPAESPYDLVPETPAPAPAPPATVDRDVPCRECSFNLRGLAEDGRCPECGAPVWRALRGELLVYAGAAYLASLRRGLLCILLATLAGVLLDVGIAAVAMVVNIRGVATGGMFDVPPMLEAMGALAELPLTGVLLYGWWLFSEPDPGQLPNRQEDTARRVVRVTTIILVVGTIGNAIAQAFALTGSVR